MSKRFQAKKLNKEDHKIDKSAKKLKKGLSTLGVVGAVGIGIYKQREQIINVVKAVKNIIIK